MLFDNLKGIEPGRIIEPQKASALEILLETAKEKVKEYEGKVSNTFQERHDNIYHPIYSELQSLPDFTEHDLQSFLLAQSGELPENQTVVRGIYSGVLLHLLTERYEAQEKSTAFTFDLSGQRFDYLFYFAKRAGEVTVKNTVGNDTCSLMGAYNGKVEKLVIENNKGDGAACWAGSDGGNVETILIHENKGNMAASLAGCDGGNVATILIHENEGNEAACWAGSYGGKVETLALYKAGSNASIGANANSILTGKKALALYEKLMRKLNDV